MQVGQVGVGPRNHMTFLPAAPAARMQRINRGGGISRKTAVCKFPGQGCLRSGTFIIVPVLKEMNFAPFGGPLQSFVCSLVPSDDLN